MKWLLVGSAWLFVVATAQDEIDLLIQSVFNTTDLPPFGGGGDGGGVSAGSGGGTVIGGGNGNGGIGNGGNGNGGNGNGGFGGGGGTIGGGGGATDGGGCGGGGAIGGGGCGGGGGGGGAVGGGGFGGNEGPIDGIPPIPPSATDNYVPEGVDPAEDCACVSFYLCPNNSVITDGSGLLDIRRPEICDSYMDVCCKVPPVEVPITPPPMGHRGCGTRNPDGIGFRITGNLDHEAQYGEFPWMIAVLRSEELSDGTVLKVYHCGGALIHRNVVLTAAHCVHGKNPSILKVRAGEWDTQTKKEMFPHQDRDVARVIVHEQYYAGALYNDVALLIVSEPFNYDDNVDVVCLPTQNDVVLSKNCFASGWGKDVFGKEGKYQVILKKIELPMVARKPCVDALRKTRLGPYFRLHESFVCAGGEPGKDTCKGDGGSPLVCPVPGQDFKYQQVGIVAWGIGCGQETPAVYVHVAHFRNWIDQNMRRLNFDYEYNY